MVIELYTLRLRRAKIARDIERPAGWWLITYTLIGGHEAEISRIPVSTAAVSRYVFADSYRARGKLA